MEEMVLTEFPYKGIITIFTREQFENSKEYNGLKEITSFETELSRQELIDRMTLPFYNQKEWNKKRLKYAGLTK